jgi:hypothetical protein
LVKDFRNSEYEPTHSKLKNILSELAVPMVSAGQVTGVLILASTKPQAFSETFVRVLSYAANQAAIAYELFAGAMRLFVAAPFLRDLYDQHFKGGDISETHIQGHVISRPYDAPFGGDFFTIKELNENVTLFLIGDATDHGLSGALRMLPLFTALTMHLTDRHTASHVLTRLHELVGLLRLEETLGTALCCRIVTDGTRRWLFGSSAGHEPLLLYRAETKDTLWFPREDSPGRWWQIGAMTAGAGEDCIEVKPNDLIVAFTDGITDSIARGDSDCAYDEVIVNVLRNKHHNTERIANSIIERAQAGDVEDDLTVVVLRVKTLDTST